MENTTYEALKVIVRIAKAGSEKKMAMDEKNIEIHEFRRWIR
jgi:hypothetical protein